MVWRPIHPVAVLVQPVLCREQNKTGVIIGRRGINPFKGEFALPGGFVEFGETAEAAARREIFEEMQMKVGDIHFSHTYADDEGHFLVFFHGGLIYREHLEAMFMGSSECPEMAIAFEPQNLCFPSHTQALERYLNSI